jgi:hypothetical protein
VFSSRAQEIGLSSAAIQVAIDNSIGTMGQFGFSTSYIPGPGQQDETPLKDLVKVLYNHANIDDVTMGQMTAVRRLYLEAYTMGIAELRRSVEQPGGEAIRSVPLLERNDRQRQQAIRLSGVETEAQGL